MSGISLDYQGVENQTWVSSGIANHVPATPLLFPGERKKGAVIMICVYFVLKPVENVSKPVCKITPNHLLIKSLNPYRKNKKIEGMA
jgi:hypothetical protein